MAHYSEKIEVMYKNKEDKKTKKLKEMEIIK